MKKTVYFLLLLANTAWSQIYFNSAELTEEEEAEYAIQHIGINDNVRTKDYIILRELHFDEGDTLRLSELFLAQKRVLNLFLFNRVIFDLIGTDQGVMLLITVSEMWYIFPIPYLSLNERSWNKLSYGAKLLYYNFFGRNVLLNLTTGFGYNPALKFSYRNPWFGGNLKLLTNFIIYKTRLKSQNLDYQRQYDTRIGFDWMIGRRFGHFFYAIANIGYAEIRHPNITLSSDGQDELPFLNLSLIYDNRDLTEYPHQGIYASAWVKRVKSRQPMDYARYGADLRTYLPLGRSTLALRMSSNLAHGRVPLYDRAFFGYLDRIRGEFFDKYEGENLIIGGAEFRFPLLKIRYLDLSHYAFPGFESYYRDLKFGLSAGIFYDAGAIWYRKEMLNMQNYHSGFGAGLHIHIPYADLIRLELAFNDELKPEFIADLYVAF